MSEEKKIFTKCKYKDLKMAKDFCVYKHAYDMWKLIMQCASEVCLDNLTYLEGDLSDQYINMEIDYSLFKAIAISSAYMFGSVDKFILTAFRKKYKYYNFKKILKKRKKIKFLKKKFFNKHFC